MLGLDRSKRDIHPRKVSNEDGGASLLSADAMPAAFAKMT